MGLMDILGLKGKAEVTNTINMALENLNSQVNQQFVNNSNFVTNNVAQNQTINWRNGPTGVINCDIAISQYADNKISTMLSGTLQNSSQVQNTIDSQVEQTSDQVAKALAELIGGDAKSSNYANLQTTVKNIMANELTVNNIAQTMNSIIVRQDNNWVNEGVINCTGDTKSLKISQYAALEMATQSIMNTISNNIFTNTEINRIAQSAKQVGEAKSVSGFASIAMALIAAAILFLVLKFTKIHWSVILFVAVVFIGVIFYMKAKQQGPFKPSYWGCATITNASGDLVNTGKCEPKSNSTDGPFPDQGTCETLMQNGGSQNCPQYWGCNVNSNKLYDKSCKQYKNLGGYDGNGLGFPNNNPYYTKQSCEAAAPRSCSTVWGCDIEGRDSGVSQGVYKQGPCVEYNKDATVIPVFTYPTREACGGDSGKCGGIWMRPSTEDTDKCKCVVSYVDPKTLDNNKIPYYQSKTLCLNAKSCPLT